MKTYKMIISYDGTEYNGWQIQPNGRSIQETIQKAIKKVLQETIVIHGAGRTDAGVHAAGQTAHFKTAKALFAKTLLKSINALIPKDIRVISLERVPSDFHARYSAKEKIYLYKIHTKTIQLPFERKYALHCTYPLDVTQIKSSLPYLLGRKNFLSFAHEAGFGAASKDPYRTLYDLSIDRSDEGFTLLFRGDGFLYKMVRNITGTLLEIGRGKIPPSALEKILAAQDRRKAKTTAPPHGLILHKIIY